MVCMGLEPGAAGWQAHMNPLSYDGPPYEDCCFLCAITPKSWIQPDAVTSRSLDQVWGVMVSLKATRREVRGY